MKNNNKQENSRITVKALLFVIAALSLLVAYSLFLPTTGAYFTNSKPSGIYTVVFNSSN
jgi:hypothetical protein